jgi:RNA polymerase sigma factor (sigma-70 family)
VKIGETVNRALLQSVLRIVEVEESANDPTLLDAYRNRRDDAAFGQLVKRYARLVWHVCRNLTRCDADAEDAFQATFLVLARNAGKIARPERLGSWLHGVACRVCSKARREAGRRKVRERAVANGEATNGVTDSKWDQALAAVHEELAGMPEIYRLPFVLCCLEGKGTTEAASQLGWKLGTLSGRLTRAKDLLIARLESRGIAVGAVAAAAFTVGTTNAPAAIVVSASSIASGTTIPGSILYLSQGVIGMSFHRIKLLAAAIMLTGGLGIGLGTTWLANAQDPAKPLLKEISDPRNANLLGDVVNQATLDIPNPNKKWEYYYNPKHDGRANGIKPSEFEQLLADLEPYGWEFVGEIKMRVASTSGGEPAGTGGVSLPTYVFRRPVKSPVELQRMAKLDQRKDVSNTLQMQSVWGCAGTHFSLRGTDCRTCHQVPQGEGSLNKPQTPDANQTTFNHVQQDFKASFQSALTVIDQQQKKIAVLEAALQARNVPLAKPVISHRFSSKELSIDASEMKLILDRIAPKIGFADFRTGVIESDGGESNLDISGTPESIEWAKSLIQTLAGKTDPVKPVRP